MSQHDEMIWHIVNNQFCSFKTTIGSAKSDKRDFCRHPYSVTGLCNRSSCPLANSRYAVVREKDGRVDLFLKTVERAHSPKNLWERISLSRNYDRALAQLDEHLAHFPKNLIHRNKQRLTKIHQMLIRMRRIKLKERAGRKAKTVGINRKIEQREERREKKALVAAKLEDNIEKELLGRLANGTYGDIYNMHEAGFRKALEQNDMEEEEGESEEEMEEEYDSEEESEEEGVVEYVEDLEEEESEEEDMEELAEGWEDEEESGSFDEDDEDEESSSSEDEEDSKPLARKRKGTRIEIEYENEEGEEEPAQEEAPVVAGMAW